MRSFRAQDPGESLQIKHNEAVDIGLMVKKLLVSCHIVPLLQKRKCANIARNKWMVDSSSIFIL